MVPAVGVGMPVRVVAAAGGARGYWSAHDGYCCCDFLRSDLAAIIRSESYDFIAFLFLWSGSTSPAFVLAAKLGR